MEPYFTVIICHYFKRYKAVPAVEDRDSVPKRAPDLVLGKSPEAAEPAADREGLGCPEREAGREGPQEPARAYRSRTPGFKVRRESNNRGGCELHLTSQLASSGKATLTKEKQVKAKGRSFVFGRDEGLGKAGRYHLRELVSYFKLRAAWSPEGNRHGPNCIVIP